MNNEQEAPEIEGMAGRQHRMRMVSFEPGGVFGPIHGHKDRPGIKSASPAAVPEPNRWALRMQSYREG
jgi:hypothetical protein